MIVLTSNGLSSDKLLEDLARYTKNCSSAVIVKTAANPLKRIKGFPQLEHELRALGLTVQQFDFDTDTPAELLRYDVAELSGGDPFYLMRSIRRAKAEPVLQQIAKENILIGVSGGAIALQKDMSLIARFSAETGRRPYDDLNGTGIVTHEIMPHYSRFCAQYGDFEARIRQYETEKGCTVTRLSDGEGVIIPT